MDRVTVLHRTPVVNLPLIEVDGLRTRADLSDRLGPLGPFDAAAPGRHANGRRVSGWVSRAHADTLRDELGAGIVRFSVDPRRALAGRAQDRQDDPAGAWERLRPLAAWLAEAGDVTALPDDLEVHQEQPVRAKLLRILAPDPEPGAYGPFDRIVAEVADTDRVAAKLVMHLALAAADGDGADPAFLAACALAWRDTEDARDLGRRVARADAEGVLEAVLVEQEDAAPEAVGRLRDVLDEVRAAAGEDGDLGERLMDRSEASLTRIVRGGDLRG
mgnify:CR=1 FL=1